jgi:RND superfamily putative drug exporter
MPRGWPVFTLLGVAVLVFLLGGAGGSYQGKLGEVQKNDNASYLPGSAESTKVGDESAKFLEIENLPGFVVYSRPSGLTAEDRTAITARADALRSVPGLDVAAMTPPEYSSDNSAASSSSSWWHGPPVDNSGCWLLSFVRCPA